MKKNIKQKPGIDWKKELREWIAGAILGVLAGPVLFHFFSFVLEPYAKWLEFLLVTLLWRIYIRKKTFHISEKVREWIEVFVVAGILALNIRTFVIQAYKIPSGSMIPTLQIKDHLFVSRFNYWTKLPRRGEIVVFRFPLDHKKDFIKRVIAVEGDTICIKDKQVFVNDIPVDEPYKFHSDPNIIPGNVNVQSSEIFVQAYKTNKAEVIAEGSPRDNLRPMLVPEGYIFVMGDNRDSSYDSRFWGFLSRRELKGKALVIYLPFNRIRIIR